MIEWIKSLFCDHEWNEIDKGHLTRDGERIGHYRDFICIKCLKKKALRWE